MEGYSRAIELHPLQAVYWSNRAAAHIRLENYGSALTDATKAIELNPKYIKARARPSPVCRDATTALHGTARCCLASQTCQRPVHVQ